MSPRLSQWWTEFQKASGISPKEKGGTPEGDRRGYDMLNIPEPGTRNNRQTMPPLFSSANVAETRRATAWLNDRIAHAEKEGAFTETVILTPVLAELLLERNPNNRNVREKAVVSYATDIKNGDWAFNGESIKLSVEGLLNDGQHRCHAVIRAGRSIKTSIAFGLARETRMTVDQGAVRTAGNYLSMAGHSGSNHIAAIATMIWRYETLGTLDSRSGSPTKTQVSHVVEENPSISESLAAIPSGASIGRSRSVLAFCHFLLAKRARIHADSFILRLCLGDGLTRKDPIFWCRERLMSDHKMRAGEKAELILRTWNAYRRGNVQTKSSPITGELPHIER